MTPEELELARWTLRGLFWLAFFGMLFWAASRKDK